MALTDKEAALRVVEQLPDDVSWDDIVQALGRLVDSPGRHGVSEIQDGSEAARATEQDEVVAPVDLHLERHGRFLVLTPDRPVPPLSSTYVDDVLDEMRREREARWFGRAAQNP